jgi:hypothetical protein
MKTIIHVNQHKIRKRDANPSTVKALYHFGNQLRYICQTACSQCECSET